jgi:hypothetical protein
MMRAAIALISYLGGIWAFLVAICVAPGESLALISPQAYSRVVAQAEWIAYQAATKPSVVSTVATAAASSSPASIAIRAVAGPLGWAALGVTVGIALYQTYYSDQKIQQLKTAATPAGALTIPGYSGPIDSRSCYQNCTGLPSGKDQVLYVPPGGSGFCFGSQPNLGLAGWSNGGCIDWGGSNSWRYFHDTGGANPMSQTPGPPPTAPQVQQYLSTLPASDPLSVESNSKPLGQGVTPDTGSQTTTVPVSPAEMPTTVKPSSQVGPSDIKIADNVPPPGGSQTTQPTTEQSTTTTTKTTNPDGSVTEQKTTTASVSCTAPGGHEQRTMGTVLQQHLDKWNSSGLLAAVNLLKNLTWPSTLPVVDLPSAFFGTQHVDFNQWAWFFTALRTLVIAVASLAAYRIIFVGR